MTTATTKPFSFPFPVADTESGPVIEWDSHALNLRFTDYLSNRCEVVFRDVSHFEFLVEDELDSRIYQYDGAVEVVDSPVIAKLIEIGDIPAGEAEHFRHLVIGFNEIGAYLVVVCRDLESKRAEQDVVDRRATAHKVGE